MKITFMPFTANSSVQTASWNGVQLRWPDGAPVKAGDVTMGKKLTFDVDTGVVSDPEKPR